MRHDDGMPPVRCRYRGPLTWPRWLAGLLPALGLLVSCGDSASSGPGSGHAVSHPTAQATSSGPVSGAYRLFNLDDKLPGVISDVAAVPGGALLAVRRSVYRIDLDGSVRRIATYPFRVIALA